MSRHEFYDPRTKRNFAVHGEELVDVKSEPKAHSPGRFTEIQIFKLEETGRFAVVITGRSLRFHSGTNPCMKNGKPLGVQVTYDDLTFDHVPCPRCRPASEGDDHDIAFLEEDRSKITICEDGPAVRHALEGTHPDGTRFLSGIGEQAWLQFAKTQGIPESDVTEIR